MHTPTPCCYEFNASDEMFLWGNKVLGDMCNNNETIWLFNYFSCQESCYLYDVI